MKTNPATVASAMALISSVGGLAATVKLISIGPLAIHGFLLTREDPPTLAGTFDQERTSDSEATFMVVSSL